MAQREFKGVPGDGPKANAMWQPQRWTFLGGYRG